MTKIKPKLPRQNFIGVLFLNSITSGIYFAYWFNKIGKELNKLKNKEKIGSIAIGFIVFLGITRFLSIFAPEGTSLMMRLPYWIPVIYLSFLVKDLLEENYKADLSGFLTLFFGPIYLQYKMNQINVQYKTNKKSVQSKEKKEFTKSKVMSDKWAKQFNR